MKLKRYSDFGFSWDMLRAAIKDGSLKRNDLLEINGRYWKVLDVHPGEIFIWQCSGPTEIVIFNEDGSNEYEGSDIQRYARETIPGKVPAEMLELVTEDGFNPLSTEEITKFLPIERDRIATDEYGDTIYWWTRSSRDEVGSAFYVCSSGYVTSSSSVTGCWFVPACHLQAT